MKKLLSLLLALMLLLASCGTQPAGTPDSPEKEPETEVLPEMPEEEPERLDLTKVQVADRFYDLSALEVLQDELVVDAGLVSPTELILLCGETGDTVKLLDLETGALETCCVLDLETEPDQSWSNTDLKSIDPLVVVDYYNEKTYLLSPQGELRLTLDSANYWICGRTGLIRYGEGSSIYLADTVTGEERHLGTLPADYLYSSPVGFTAGETGLILEATAVDDTEATLIIDMETGQLSAAYRGWGHCAALNGRMNVSVDNDTLEYDIEPSATFTLSARRQSGERVTQVSEQVDISVFSPDGTADLLNDWLFGEAANDFEGRALVELWMGDELHFLLWDYSELIPEETGATIPEAYEPPHYDLGQAGERAAEMSRKYGVQIYVGEAVLNAPFPDYDLSACTDPVSLNKGLDVLEEAFSIYPEGYLDQLGGERVREICFYLSGEMTPLDPMVSIENPSGLACQVGDLELIAMNADGYLQAEDVIHELTHLMDHWLSDENVLDETQWISMNPEDFSYHYAYIDEDGKSYEFTGDDIYTSWDSAYYEGDVESVYFVDPYSTTYPTEDRARLMEYLLMDPEYDPPAFFASSHVQDKLRYYFLCIRMVCDTTEWTEPPIWETRLAQAAGEDA